MRPLRAENITERRQLTVECNVNARFTTAELQNIHTTTVRILPATTESKLKTIHDGKNVPKTMYFLTVSQTKKAPS